MGASIPSARNDGGIHGYHCGAEFYAGKGMEDSHQAKVLGAVAAAQHVHLLAEHYGICVVLHNSGSLPTSFVIHQC